jgi:hypothetical protein
MDGLIKHHISRDINTSFGNNKALEALMHVAIAKENSLFGTKLELVGIE